MRNNKNLLNHEMIHLKQQLEMLIIPFYLFYVIEFVVKLATYKQWAKAYRNISFEREAYRYESNLSYLKQRRFWSFLKYIRTNDLQT